MQTKYINPYLAGILLGLVLLFSFLIAGRGIGASGAVNQVVVKGYEISSIDHIYVEKYQPT